MTRVRIFLSLSLLLVALPSHADWTEPGAAYLCDIKSNIFVMQATMDSESAPTVGPRSGYTQVEKSTQITCNLSHVKISTKVTLDPPRASGICGGVQHVWLDNFLIGKKKIFEYSNMFNDTCSGDPILYEIRIHEDGALVKTELCYTSWNWDNGYADPKCKNL